jgi:hypothetical protein
MSSSSWLRGVAAATLVLLCIGCSAPEKPELAPVRGKVSYRGKPLGTGTIVFAPDSLRGNSGPLARADIQADGSYQLKAGTLTGAPPGWHRVTVAAVADTPQPPGQKMANPRTLLPEKYRDPELSGLSCEVQAGKDNTINFNLE